MKSESSSLVRALSFDENAFEMTEAILQHRKWHFLRRKGRLPEVLLVQPRVFMDARGFFFESYHQEEFAEAGIREVFRQDNHSQSIRGTLRGLHYQLSFPQAKLCRVVHGEVLDVVVDIRRGSARFGKWTCAKLSEKNKLMIYVPVGFAHGFLVLSETADFLYKCSEVYHPEDERGIAWNDPDLAVSWAVSNPLISDKDAGWPTLAKIPPEELPPYMPTNR